MGTWGTAIKDNDAFADVYDEYFDLYNKGGQPENISKKIIEDNWETIKNFSITKDETIRVMGMKFPKNGFI